MHLSSARDNYFIYKTPRILFRGVFLIQQLAAATATIVVVTATAEKYDYQDNYPKTVVVVTEAHTLHLLSAR